MVRVGGGSAALTEKDTAEDRDVFSCAARTVAAVHGADPGAGAVPEDDQVLCRLEAEEGAAAATAGGTSFAQQFRLFFFRSVCVRCF